MVRFEWSKMTGARMEPEWSQNGATGRIIDSIAAQLLVTVLQNGAD